MSYNVTGKIISIGQKESGVSKAGKEWEKIEFVIETEGEYPKKLCFTLFGDKCALIADKTEGKSVEVSFDVESREYNGRWFHNVNAYRVMALETAETNTATTGNTNDDGDGDLPF